MSKKKSINVTVLVDEAHRKDMTDLEKRLKDKGFVLREPLDAIGVLTGSVPAASLTALSKVTGVSAVEEERTDYRTQQGS